MSLQAAVISTIGKGRLANRISKQLARSQPKDYSNPVAFCLPAFADAEVELRSNCDRPFWAVL